LHKSPRLEEEKTSPFK